MQPDGPARAGPAQRRRALSANGLQRDRPARKTAFSTSFSHPQSYGAPPKPGPMRGPASDAVRRRLAGRGLSANLTPQIARQKRGVGPIFLPGSDRLGCDRPARVSGGPPTCLSPRARGHPLGEHPAAGLPSEIRACPPTAPSLPRPRTGRKAHENMDEEQRVLPRSTCRPHAADGPKERFRAEMGGIIQSAQVFNSLGGKSRLPNPMLSRPKSLILPALLARSTQFFISGVRGLVSRMP